MVAEKQYAIYKCNGACEKKFLAGDFKTSVSATGQHIKHCGQVASFKKYLDWTQSGRGICEECEKEQDIDKNNICAECAYDFMATYSQQDAQALEIRGF